MQKRCSHCGREFGCQQGGGCWCGNLKLDPARLAWLKERYDNCLCPACLTAVATGAALEEPSDAR